jgi:RNA polymerase sigma-70 factor (ECF subfamily)
MVDVDRLIASRLRAGDQQVLREVVDRNGRALLTTAQRITRDRAAAEDVVQDVFAGLWSRPASYDPERGGLTNWLHMRCRGAAVDNVRSRAARDRRELFADNTGSREYDDEYRSATPASILHRALDELSATDRELIELTFFRGFSYRTAAELLSIPEGTAKSRIRRVLSTLKHQLIPVLTPG